MDNRLIALELHGYKTFANKTQFAFPGKVTAVVGPNGSGKSNIADSVRWVLGEQAYSILRGKKTVDMIFSGSEQRSRASMASVSITFDNQTGWLPVEFSEVNIIRRAYRDGENEYLLNNQRVRLKEINELLANSGLGDRTYTIIGQGLVDTALSLRPEERRKFFEEAAGIGLYRDRREEAVQKLDKTLRNMERVQDLIAELKPRIGSLLKNKEKSNQYKQIQDDLQLLLKDWYGFHWHQTQKELSGAVEFYKQQKDDLEKIQREKEALEEQLNQIQSNLNENRSQLADLHKELALYHSKTEEITRNIAVLDERETSYKKRLSEISEEIDSNLEQADIIQKELNGLESTSLQYKDEFQEVTALLISATGKLNSAITEQRSKENILEETRKGILSSESKLLSWESALKNNQREIDHKEADNEKKKAFLISMQQSIEKKIVEKSSLLEKIDSQKSILSQKIAKQQDLQADKEFVGSNIELLKEKRQNAITNISKMKAELDVLKEAEAHFAGFTSGSGDLVNASRQKLIPGNLSLIIDHLEIPEKYETAIAAALGEVLEGIILENSSNTEKVLDYLEKNSISKTVLIPADLKRNTASENPYKESKVISAGSIIADESDSSRLIKTVLERTLLVEERSIAMNLFPDLQPGWKIVTLKGEVFDSRGVISAGIEYRVKPLKRKREKSVLLSELNISEVFQEDIEKQIANDQIKFQSLNDTLVISDEEMRLIKENVSSLEYDAHKLDLEKEQSIHNKAEEQKNISELENQIALIKAEITELQKTIEVEKQKIISLKREEAEKITSEDSDSLEELRKEVIELTSWKSVAEKLEAQHLQTLNRTRENLKAVALNKESLEAKLGDIGKSNNETIQTKLELQSQKEDIKEKIGTITDRIKPLEEKVEAIIGVQGQLFENVDKGRRSFAISERHTLQSQLKVEKLRDQINSLQEKIEEDFGMITANGETGYEFNQPLPLEGIVASLQEITALPEGFEGQITQKKAYLRRIGPINPEAEKEFDEANSRFQFLEDQLSDLNKAEKDLRQIVNELDALMKKEFMKTFIKVEKEFSSIFTQLFNGGEAKIYIEDAENILDGGIEIEATLPGRRKQELGLLSGGERSLTAVALIFSLLKISPTPFCILDEVDAMLDESNVVRFGELLGELSDTTQFIVITHNRNTVQLADVLYGVTMGKDSVSQVISLKLDELTEEMVQ